MKNRISGLFIILLFWVVGLPQAKAVYDVNDQCKNAWVKILDFDFDGARLLIHQEIKTNPKNYYALYLDQTCDVFQMLVNAGENDYENLMDNFEKKRDIMDHQDEDSPYYLSCYSEMEIQLGIFNVINGDEFSGLKRMYNAYKRVYQNLDKYPDFGPSKKLDGFFNVAIANLPPFVKWAVSFFGVSANIDQGFTTLISNYEKQKNIRGVNAESALIVILAAKINKTPERVYEFTRSLDSSVANTFVHQYFRANIAYRTAHNEEAIQVLATMNKDKNDYTRVITDYLTGKVMMRNGNPQAAIHLKRYLEHHRNLEYYKEINYYLAEYYYLQGDQPNYDKYRKLCIDKGMEMQERDREALYDAKTFNPPNKHLLRARLYFDGGYLEKSEQELTGFNPQKAGGLVNHLDYLLLKAKLAKAKGQIAEAISLFKQVIEEGEEEDFSFAAEAALSLGQIYKAQNKTSLADEYFKKSLKLYKSDFYEYIEDKARKGKSES